MLNIIYVTREYPPSKRIGGLAIYTQEIAEKLAGKGNNIHVVCASDSSCIKEISVVNGVFVHRLPNVDYSVKEGLFGVIITLFRTLFYFVKYRKNVANEIDTICKNNQIDLIEFPEFGAEGFFWLKRNRDVTSIIRIHGASFFDNNSGKKTKLLKRPLAHIIGKFEEWQLKNAEYITTPSVVYGKWVAEHLNLTESRIQLIPNFINTEFWSNPNCFNSHLAQPACKEIQIFSAGTISKNKGFEELYEACKVVRQDGLLVNLIIAGRKGGSFARKLSSRINDNGDGDWISLIGSIPRCDLKNYYSSSEIVIFPSYFEIFGLVCIEAMASGGLVIASRAGGMSEIINDYQTGFLVDPKNVMQLAKQITKVIKMETSVKAMIRKKAKIAAIERYSCDEMYSQLMTYYSGLNSNRQI